ILFKNIKMTAIKNSVCVITGGGSGIGRALAIELVGKGAKVVIGDIVPEELQETVQLAGSNIYAYDLDVSKMDSIHAFKENVLREFPDSPLILFNNAGVNLASGYFMETPLDDFEWLININLWGVIKMTHAFLPHMYHRKDGHIVNISSMLGYAATPRSSAYCTSKFAVKGFTDALKVELLNAGIGVSSVHPGGIKTNIIRKSKLSDHLDEQQTWHLLNKIEKKSLTMPAKQAAQIIINGVERNKSRILIGKDAKAVDWLVRIFPDTYFKLLENLLKKI
ncbi:MAG: SDR family NAD(P)-dependent oxidoreductase, partial [Saprospiraceae bacterium]